MTFGRFGRRRQAVAARVAKVRALPFLSLLASVALVAACLEVPTPPPSFPASASGHPTPGASAATPAASPTATATTGSPAVATKPTPCPGSDRTPNAAPGRQLSGSSGNWSGYVAATKKTGVTCVEGSWVEPSVTCPRTGHQAVAIWIGIDGFSASTLGIPSTNVLVQIGTQVDCQSGVASHGFWHEILPGEQHEVPVAGRLRAGDHVSAKIYYGSGKFTMVIFDAETLFSYTITAAAPGAPRKSAEWIVEAPASDCPGSCKPVPLPKFSPVSFTGARATIGGQRARINNDSWSSVKLKMVRNGVTRTATSKLGTSGTSFRVSFVHA